jgi:hypothetical protein
MHELNGVFIQLESEGNSELKDIVHRNIGTQVQELKTILEQPQLRVSMVGNNQTNES